jgi:hypothetical protein
MIIKWFIEYLSHKQDGLRRQLAMKLEYKEIPIIAEFIRTAFLKVSSATFALWSQRFLSSSLDNCYLHKTN